MPLARSSLLGVITAVGFLASAISTFSESAPSEEIPIERCDRLPVVTVHIAGEEKRFLVDTAATSMLNIQSFSQGRVKEVRVSSWRETTVTSAREVTLPDFTLGEYRLRNLKLPAIDLSPIAQACGGPIDGILGVDLLERMGATLDLKRRVARLDGDAAGADEPEVSYDYRENQRRCIAAFNRADADYFADCLDPQVVLFTPWGEFNGRAEVLEHLQQRYFNAVPPAHLKLHPREFRELGDAVWYSYDYTIVLAGEVIEARGMAVCRKSGGRWRLLNMHNSFAERRAAKNR